MDVDLRDRNGANKRINQQRLSVGGGFSGSTNKVCVYWLAGNCSRRPCNFLHQNPQETRNPPRSDHYKKPNVGRNNNSKWGSNKFHGDGGGGGAASRSSRPHPQNTVCNFFVRGAHCRYGDTCRYLHAWSCSAANDFSLLTVLEGHKNVITGIALPSGSDKLYSGSKDGTVRVWDCQTGKCVADLVFGQEVACLVGEGSWIFAGLINTVKAWNPQMGVDQSLNGPGGQVYALVVGNGFLFAGVQDGSILAWKVNASLNSFEPAASLSGHQRAVISLVVGGAKLYSGSIDHTIRVWHLETFQCVQTLNGHTNVVMSLLCWDQFLLSCSLDQTIKVWVGAENGSMEVTYTHEFQHGVLKLSGMLDKESKPILLCSCNNNCSYLFDLPSFAERGRIFSKEEVRAITAAPGDLGLFFTGEGSGELKVWKWSS